MESIHQIVAPFYQQALTVNPGMNPAEVLERILADDFQSINSQEVKDKATLIKQIGFFWKLIPNLTWVPQDQIVEGNKAVIRSVASGTPVGSFMGIECDGSKSFKIDTTDIHEFANDRIARAWHLEDWATAMRQLRA